jgi:hypothetical protein
MKKYISILIVLLGMQSCKLKDQKEDKIESVKPTKNPVVTLDKDENGCLASAGFTWSQLNKECVKVFTGMQLNPFDKPKNEDETVCAYVLFSVDVNQAEVFLPSQTKSIILQRASEGQPWVFEDWQLIVWKGYVLKKGDTNKFVGDGEIGNKVTGSDVQE